MSHQQKDGGERLCPQTTRLPVKQVHTRREPERHGEEPGGPSPPRPAARPPSSTGPGHAHGLRLRPRPFGPVACGRKAHPGLRTRGVSAHAPTGTQHLRTRGGAGARLQTQPSASREGDRSDTVVPRLPRLRHNPVGEWHVTLKLHLVAGFTVASGSTDF